MVNPLRRRILAGLLAGGLAATLSGCQTTGNPDDVSMMDAFDVNIGYPRKVAILPFVNRSADPAAGETVRRLFFNFFSSLNYLDMEMASVDSTLRKHKRYYSVVSGHDFTLSRVCQDLGVDGVITGEVKDFSKAYAVIYTHTSVTLDVALKHCGSGKTLWSNEETRTDRDGSLPTDLTGLAMSVATTLFSYQTATIHQTATMLTMGMVEDIPAPPTVSDPPPKIKMLLHNGAGRFVKPGETLKVVVVGEPGQTGTWDLGTLVTDLPLDERSPGVYVGSYRVGPSDRTVDARLVGRLSTATGATGVWIDFSSGVNLGEYSTVPRVVEADLTLHAADGPFLVEDLLLVRKGATLTVEPGTVLWGTVGGLIVRGALVATGTAEAPVRLLGSGAETWKGILVNGPDAQVLLSHAEVTRSEFGIKVDGGQATVADSSVSDNTWGIVVTGGRAAIADTAILRSTQAGISAKDGDVMLQRNLIAENAGGGLQFQASTVTADANDVFGNAKWDVKNHDADTPLALPGNWWGQTNAAAVRSVGPVEVTPVREVSHRQEKNEAEREKRRDQEEQRNREKRQAAPMDTPVGALEGGEPSRRAFAADRS